MTCGQDKGGSARSSDPVFVRVLVLVLVVVFAGRDGPPGGGLG